MPTILRLLLVPLLLLAFLAACDPRSEEEASLAPAQDLSATEIIEHVIEAEKSIGSLQEDRTDISTQLVVPMGDVDTTPQESRSLRIQVGEDVYLKDEFIAPELCDGEPNCSDSVFPFDETLQTCWTRRSTTKATPTTATAQVTGSLSPSPGARATMRQSTVSGVSLPIEHSLGTDDSGGFVECPALESMEPPEPSQLYSFEFSWLTTPERVESASDGLIHIQGAVDEPFWSLGLTPEIEAIYAECGIDPAELFKPPEFPEPAPGYFPEDFRDYFPERYEGVADIWVDPATFFVHRIEWSLNAFNGDRLLQTEETTSRYSLFNEAELPGPLPQ